MDFKFPIDFFKVRYVKGWLMAVTSILFRQLDQKTYFLSPYSNNKFLTFTYKCM